MLIGYVKPCPERVVITPIWVETLLISVTSACVYICCCFNNTGFRDGMNSYLAGRLTILLEHVEIVHDQRPDEQHQSLLVPV